MVSRLSGGQKIAGSTPATLTKTHGSVAHLEERLHDTQEVAGSRPAIPTPTPERRRNETTMQIGVRYLAKASMERLSRNVGTMGA